MTTVEEIVMNLETIEHLLNVLPESSLLQSELHMLCNLIQIIKDRLALDIWSSPPTILTSQIMNVIQDIYETIDSLY